MDLRNLLKFTVGFLLIRKIIKALFMRKIIAMLLMLSIAGCFKSLIETDINNYSKILAEWKRSGLIDHFPEAIPEDATDVLFSASPAILQGGAWIQVRIRLSAQETRKIYDNAKKISRQHHDGGNSSSYMSGTPGSVENRLASTYFYTSGSKDDSFPPDYRVFIFDARSSKQNSNPDWNHGTSRGVAISLERNEVVYWAESW